MGYLLYGRPPEEIEVDDRTLAHLKMVILAKLRRDESFAFSFEHGSGEIASGRSTIWMHHSIPLQFNFIESKQGQINREWLDELVKAANSVDGLRILPEPAGEGVEHASTAAEGAT
jgi:hypothetical protein